MARPQRLKPRPSSDPLEQKLDAAPINAIARHDEANQRISNQLDARTLCHGVHNTYPRPGGSQFTLNGQ
jgi:hypothetical protein